MEKQFEKLYGYKATKEVSAAGRINIIGEHVDYCGGLVMPASLNLNCKVLGRRNDSHYIRLKTCDLQMDVTIDIDHLREYRGLSIGNYQAGVAYELQKIGYHLVGCDLLFSISIPIGSGLSSSAAIEVATGVMLLELIGEQYDLKEIAIIGQKAENEYCNVSCGIMDQFASAMGVKDKAILLNCKTLDYEYVPLELGDYTFIVANSNKPHSLINSKYNERRSEVESALKDIQTVMPNITCLADISLVDFMKVRQLLKGKVLNRATHVVNECNRVKECVACLKNGDLVELGRLISASHQSLAELYEVTGDELDTLAYSAQSYHDCLGARMIGGGFGGCVICLVKKDAIEDFKAVVGKSYFDVIGYHADFYEISIEDGVTVKHTGNMSR